MNSGIIDKACSKGESSGTAPGEGKGGGPGAPRPAVEALAAFAVAMLVAGGLARIAPSVPFLARNLQGFIAAAFIYLPVWSARRHGIDFARYGFTARPLGRSIALGLAVPAVLFPLFLVGFIGFYQVICGNGGLAALAPPAWCTRFGGWSGLLHPRAPADLPLSILDQVVVIALPEELFFRGYLLALLERAWPPRRRVAGGGIGLALVVSSLLFAIGHLVVDADPRRLATFFPGLLFGWIRSATGSIMAGTFVHASANLFMSALQRTLF